MTGSIFRYCFLSVLCFSGFLCMLDWMLPRRRKYMVFILYYAFKLVFLNIVMGMILNSSFRGNTWWDTLYTVAVFGAAVVNYLILCYTYRESFIKIAVTACFAELVPTSLTMFSMVLINLLEGRADGLAYLAPFRWLDILIALLFVGMLWIVNHYMYSYFSRFKNYRLRNGKIWWSAFVTYITLMSLTMLDDKSRASLTLIMLILCGGGFTVIAAAVVRRYLKSVQTECRYLSAQQQLMESYYTTLYGQIYQMERQQAEVDRKMQGIIKSQDARNGAGKVSAYLQELKQEYQELKAGVYCDDWTLDALLFGQSEIIGKKGITFECSMQGYQAGMVEKQDLTEILLYLMNFGVLINEKSEYAGRKWIQLQVSSVKNQMVIEFKGTCQEKNNIRRRVLRLYIKKYNGGLRVEKGAGSIGVVITLERTERK